MNDENETVDAIASLIAIVIFVVVCIAIWKFTWNIRKEINSNGLKSIIERVWVGTNQGKK